MIIHIQLIYFIQYINKEKGHFVSFDKIVGRIDNSLQRKNFKSKSQKIVSNKSLFEFRNVSPTLRVIFGEELQTITYLKILTFTKGQVAEVDTAISRRIAYNLAGIFMDKMRRFLTQVFGFHAAKFLHERGRRLIKIIDSFLNFTLYSIQKFSLNQHIIDVVLIKTERRGKDVGNYDIHKFKYSSQKKFLINPLF